MLSAAKSDRAETSIIGALAGFAGCEGILAVVAAAVLLVSVSRTFRAQLDATGGFILLCLDMGKDGTEMLVVRYRRVCDALLMRSKMVQGRAMPLCRTWMRPSGNS